MKKSWMFLALAGLALLYFLKPRTRVVASPEHPIAPSAPPPTYEDIPKNLPVPSPAPGLPPNVLTLEDYYVMLDAIRAAGGFGGAVSVGPQFVAQVRASEAYWKLTPAPAITTGVSSNMPGVPDGMIVSTG